MSTVTEENEHERENDKETALPPRDWLYVDVRIELQQ